MADNPPVASQASDSLSHFLAAAATQDSYVSDSDIEEFSNPHPHIRRCSISGEPISFSRPTSPRSPRRKSISIPRTSSPTPHIMGAQNPRTPTPTRANPNPQPTQTTEIIEQGDIEIATSTELQNIIRDIRNIIDGPILITNRTIPDLFRKIGNAFVFSLSNMDTFTSALVAARRNTAHHIVEQADLLSNTIAAMCDLDEDEIPAEEFNEFLRESHTMEEDPIDNPELPLFPPGGIPRAPPQATIIDPGAVTLHPTQAPTSPETQEPTHAPAAPSEYGLDRIIQAITNLDKKFDNRFKVIELYTGMSRPTAPTNPAPQRTTPHPSQTQPNIPQPAKPTPNTRKQSPTPPKPAPIESPPIPSYANAAKHSQGKGVSKAKVSGSNIAKTLSRDGVKSSVITDTGRKIAIALATAPPVRPSDQAIHEALRIATTNGNPNLGPGRLLFIGWNNKGNILRLGFSLDTSATAINNVIPNLMRQLPLGYLSHGPEDSWTRLAITGVPTGLGCESLQRVRTKQEIHRLLRDNYPNKEEFDQIDFKLSPDWIANPINITGQQRLTSTIAFTFTDKGGKCPRRSQNTDSSASTEPNVSSKSSYRNPPSNSALTALDTATLRTTAAPRNPNATTAAKLTTPPTTTHPRPVSRANATV